VVAKMDGTVNDVPVSAGFQITGFPTIKFIKADTNEMIDYKGQRTLHDFVKFLNENSTKKSLGIDLETLPEPKIKRSDIVEVAEVVEKHDEL
jgi:protein disulfide-isomerase A1